MRPRTLTIQTLSGTSLVAGYTASAAFQPGQAKRVRFWVSSVRIGGSGATTTTIKLQARYNDGTSTTAYVDLPSTLDDVQGSAQPKGSTFEIEHALTTGAGGTATATFYLDRPEALLDVTANVKVNATGSVGDSTVIYASMV